MEKILILIILLLLSSSYYYWSDSRELRETNQIFINAAKVSDAITIDGIVFKKLPNQETK